MTNIYQLLAKLKHFDFSEENEDGSLQDGLWALSYKIEMCDDRYKESSYQPILLTAYVYYLDEEVAAWTCTDDNETKTFVEFFITQRDGVRISAYSTGSRGREMWQFVGNKSITQDVFNDYFSSEIMPHVLKNFESDGTVDMEARFHAYEVTINMFVDNKLLNPKDVGSWKFPPELDENLL